MTSGTERRNNKASSALNALASFFCSRKRFSTPRYVVGRFNCRLLAGKAGKTKPNMAKQYMEKKVESLVVVAITFARMLQRSQCQGLVKCTSKSQKENKRQPLTDPPDQRTTSNTKSWKCSRNAKNNLRTRGMCNKREQRNKWCEKLLIHKTMHSVGWP